MAHYNTPVNGISIGQLETNYWALSFDSVIFYIKYGNQS